MQTIEFETPTLNEKGEVIARIHHRAEQLTEDLGNGVHLNMIAIPSGIFQMGSSPQYGNNEERPRHFVTIKSFMLGKFLISQDQCKAERGKLPLCTFKAAKLPIEQA